jgi:hypothetical protein
MAFKVKKVEKKSKTPSTPLPAPVTQADVNVEQEIMAIEGGEPTAEVVAPTPGKKKGTAAASKINRGLATGMSVMQFQDMLWRATTTRS